jgi:hypothetical protein
VFCVAAASRLNRSTAVLCIVAGHEGRAVGVSCRQGVPQAPVQAVQQSRRAHLPPARRPARRAGTNDAQWRTCKHAFKFKICSFLFIVVHGLENKRKDTQCYAHGSKRRWPAAVVFFT